MKNEIGLIQNEIVELRNIQCVPEEENITIHPF